MTQQTPTKPWQLPDGTLEEAERLDKEATAGPWEAQNRHSDFGPCYNTVKTATGWLCDDYGIDRLADAAFIAHVRTFQPQLLAAYRAALGEIARLTEERDNYRDTYERFGSTVNTLEKQRNAAEAELATLRERLTALEGERG